MQIGMTETLHTKNTIIPVTGAENLIVMMMRWMFRDVSRMLVRWISRSIYTSDNRKHSELQPEYFSILREPGTGNTATRR